MIVNPVTSGFTLPVDVDAVILLSMLVMLRSSLTLPVAVVNCTAAFWF